MADNSNGWMVMLDYHTLKSPSNRVLKIPSLTLTKGNCCEVGVLGIAFMSPLSLSFSHSDIPLLYFLL